MSVPELSACIVTPAFNEQELIVGFLSDLEAFLRSSGLLSRYRFTVIVVDDGSRDGTSERVREFAAKAGADLRVQLISFTRNFGHQGALIAGMTQAARERQNFVITMDSDGEHPCSVIPKLIEQWEKGAMIVHTLRGSHAALSWSKRFMSAQYYRILKWISGVQILPGMADFKLWDGYLLEQVEKHLPSCGSTRVFASWLCPDGPLVEYDQEVRKGRISRFSLRKMSSLAVGGMVRFSVLPLRISFLFGLISVAFSLFFSIFVVTSYFQGRTLGGWASLTLVVTITAGLQALMTGFLGEYLLRNTFNSSLPRFVAVRPSKSTAGPES